MEQTPQAHPRPKGMSEYAEAYFDECMALRREIKELRNNEMKRHSDTRNRAIEKCARVVEECHVPDYYRERIARKIRALKS